MKNFDGLRRFVGLQMADHVEVGVAQFNERGKFFGKLLHAVFAEKAMSGFVGLDNALGWMRFGDRHQSDLIRAATGTRRRTDDALTDGSEVFGDRHEGTLYSERRAEARRWCRTKVLVVGKSCQ